MKCNRLQYKIIECIINQASLWKDSNNIDSIQHVALLEETINNLKLSTNDTLELEGILKGLYYFIKRHD